MTSFSSAARAVHGATGTSTASMSSMYTIRRIDVSLSDRSALTLQDGDPVPAHRRAQQQHGGDDDGEDDRTQRARDPGVAVLHLREDRDGAQVEAGIDEKHDRTDRDHPVDEEVDEDGKGRAGEQRQHDLEE